MQENQSLCLQVAHCMVGVESVYANSTMDIEEGANPEGSQGGVGIHETWEHLCLYCLYMKVESLITSCG